MFFHEHIELAGKKRKAHWLQPLIPQSKFAILLKFFQTSLN